MPLGKTVEDSHQLIRELTDALRGKCVECKHNVPLREKEATGFFHIHANNNRCHLMKHEYKLIQRAEAHLME